VRLDAIAAELRPRNAWEATDLGMAMVRQEFQPVYAAWFAVALPLFLLLHLLFWGNWWLIPWLLFQPRTHNSTLINRSDNFLHVSCTYSGPLSQDHRTGHLR